MYIYTHFTYVYKSIKKKEKGGKPQEEGRAVLSEEENEEAIAIVRLKDLSLQVRILSPTMHREQVSSCNNDRLHFTPK